MGSIRRPGRLARPLSVTPFSFIDGACTALYPWSFLETGTDQMSNRRTDKRGTAREAHHELTKEQLVAGGSSVAPTASHSAAAVNLNVARLRQILRVRFGSQLEPTRSDPLREWGRR